MQPNKNQTCSREIIALLLKTMRLADGTILPSKRNILEIN